MTRRTIEAVVALARHAPQVSRNRPMRTWCTSGQFRGPSRPPRTRGCCMVVRGSTSRGARAVPIGIRRRPKAHSVHIWREKPRAGSRPARRRLPVGHAKVSRSAARGSRSVKASARRSVSRVLSRRASRRIGDGHPSGAVGRPTAHAADPRAGQRTSPPHTVARPRVAPSYLALLRVEFARFTPVCGSHRGPASSLWHWSSPHGGRALPATLRCGARTFLTPSAGLPPPMTRDHPTASLTREVYPAQAKTQSTTQAEAGSAMAGFRWRAISRRGGGRPTSARQHGRDRWPRWPARPRRS